MRHRSKNQESFAQFLFGTVQIDIIHPNNSPPHHPNVTVIIRNPRTGCTKWTHNVGTRDATRQKKKREERRRRRRRRGRRIGGLLLSLSFSLSSYTFPCPIHSSIHSFIASLCTCGNVGNVMTPLLFSRVLSSLSHTPHTHTQDEQKNIQNVK